MKKEKLVEYSLFTIAGVAVLAAVELKLIHENEILMFIIGFIGFVALLQGVFGLYNTLKT